MEWLNIIKDVAEIVLLILGAIGGYLGGRTHQKNKEKQYIKDEVEKEIVQELLNIKRLKLTDDGLSSEMKPYEYKNDEGGKNNGKKKV